jgi:hypothetical protein
MIMMGLGQCLLRIGMPLIDEANHTRPQVVTPNLGSAQCIVYVHDRSLGLRLRPAMVISDSVSPPGDW